jgi:hypothetical protein
MLEGIAFLTITTAVITSTFVARAERERAFAQGESSMTGTAASNSCSSWASPW